MLSEETRHATKRATLNQLKLLAVAGAIVALWLTYATDGFTKPPQWRSPWAQQAFEDPSSAQPLKGITQ